LPLFHCISYWHYSKEGEEITIEIGKYEILPYTYGSIRKRTAFKRTLDRLRLEEDYRRKLKRFCDFAPCKKGQYR
jgi:hypothetical protein